MKFPVNNLNKSNQTSESVNHVLSIKVSGRDTSSADVFFHCSFDISQTVPASTTKSVIRISSVMVLLETIFLSLNLFFVWGVCEFYSRHFVHNWNVNRFRTTHSAQKGIPPDEEWDDCRRGSIQLGN